MRYEEIKERNDADFKRLTGVTHQTFKHMVAVLENAMPHFGRPPKLSRADQMLMTLMYWREYRAQFHIAQDYGVSEATVSRTIRKVEDVLIRSGEFHLPGKKALKSSNTVLEVVLIDATEQPIERPKKKQRQHYSGKKKRHTQKAQVIVNQSTLEIIATAFGPGKMHDFRIFTKNLPEMNANILCLADSGYLGIRQYHANSQVPSKKSKHHPLTKEQKATNRQLARRRIFCEHVISKLKVFRILSERYRNRRKRFKLRFNLIAAIHNLELQTTT
jgi:hypothetical protein